MLVTLTLRELSGESVKSKLLCAFRAGSSALPGLYYYVHIRPRTVHTVHTSLHSFSVSCGICLTHQSYLRRINIPVYLTLISFLKNLSTIKRISPSLPTLMFVHEIKHIFTNCLQMSKVFFYKIDAKVKSLYLMINQSVSTNE